MSANGTYTLYVQDLAGNESSQSIVIGNYDDILPDVSEITASELEKPVNETVVLSAAATDQQPEGYTAATGVYYHWSTGETTQEIQVLENNTYTLYVTDEAGNVSETRSITVGNIDLIAPVVNSVTASEEPTNKDVQPEIDVTDEQSDGYTAEQDILFSLDPAGAEAATQIFISENGKYTVYAIDAAGNISDGYEIIIECIDKIKPVINACHVSTTDLTADNIVITVYAADLELGLAEKAYSIDGKKWQESNEFMVEENGEYDIYVRDKAGNITSTRDNETTIHIRNIDKDSPSFSVHQTPSEWTNEAVILQATATDSGIGLGEYAYSWDQKEWITYAERTVIKNGDYTIYARDLLGNTAAYVFHVNNIDQSAPVAKLSLSIPSEYWSDVINTIKVTAEDMESGLAAEAYSFDNGQTWTSVPEYTIYAEGTYIVFVRDVVGNIIEVEIAAERALILMTPTIHIKEEHKIVPPPAAVVVVEEDIIEDSFSIVEPVLPEIISAAEEENTVNHAETIYKAEPEVSKAPDTMTAVKSVTTLTGTTAGGCFFVMLGFWLFGLIPVYAKNLDGNYVLIGKVRKRKEKNGYSIRIGSRLLRKGVTGQYMVKTGRYFAQKHKDEAIYVKIGNKEITAKVDRVIYLESIYSK